MKRILGGGKNAMVPTDRCVEEEFQSLCASLGVQDPPRLTSYQTTDRLDHEFVFPSFCIMYRHAPDAADTCVSFKITAAQSKAGWERDTLNFECRLKSASTTAEVLFHTLVLRIYRELSDSEESEDLEKASDSEDD